jgi:hypothetical protein
MLTDTSLTLDDAPSTKKVATAKIVSPTFAALSIATATWCQDVAAQVAFGKAKVCNRFFTMEQGAGSRVGTGRFQAMGQLHSSCTGSPPRARQQLRHRL